jgi:hypothetical protein
VFREVERFTWSGGEGVPGIAKIADTVLFIYFGEVVNKFQLLFPCFGIVRPVCTHT